MRNSWLLANEFPDEMRLISCGPGMPTEPPELPTLIGDVVVCPSVADRQARDNGRSLDEELASLVVHGVLHLMSYDHVGERDAAAMRRREQELLARWREARSGEGR